MCDYVADCVLMWQTVLATLESVYEPARRHDIWLSQCHAGSVGLGLEALLGVASV